MSYTLALFLHIVGMITIFVGIGTLVFAVFALRRARSIGEVRAIVVPLTVGRKVGFESIGVIDVVVIAGVLLIALPGIFLASRIQGFATDWVRVATAAFLLIAPLGSAVINPRLHAIARAAVGSADRALDESLMARTHSLTLAVALNVMVATLLAIVFLMTTKPSLPGSLTAVVVAVSLGVLTGWPIRHFDHRRRR